MVNEKRMKVSLEDHKVLLRAKLRESEDFKVQQKRQNETLIVSRKFEIVKTERNIAFKEDQLKNGIVELNAEFEGGKRPKHFILNDIDNAKLLLDGFRQEIKDLEAMNADSE